MISSWLSQFIFIWFNSVSASSVTHLKGCEWYTESNGSWREVFTVSRFGGKTWDCAQEEMPRCGSFYTSLPSSCWFTANSTIPIHEVFFKSLIWYQRIQRWLRTEFILNTSLVNLLLYQPPDWLFSFFLLLRAIQCFLTIGLSKESLCMCAILSVCSNVTREVAGCFNIFWSNKRGKKHLSVFRV